MLGAGAEDNGDRSVATTVPIAGVLVTSQGAKQYDFVARATLTEGTYRTAISASIGPFGRTYGENLGRRVEKWLKDRAKKK